ncbi:MAG: tRNA (N(6)-L-threonylcarbamoyladenosine(37)-C(2))-methylthiotransferase MtaB [Acidobacteriaceae bacterium]
MEAYHVENFGCRASRSDGEAIAAGLRARGLSESATPDSAQLIIVNTCSVTAEADRTARAFIRRARRRNPEAKIVVTGCYAQRAPEEMAGLDGVNAVIGNSHKSLVPQIAAGLVVQPAGAMDASVAAAQSFVPVSAIAQRRAAVYVDESFAHSELATLRFAADAHQTRPNLKAQDGCGNRCSFCVIPATRGPSRSVPIQLCIEDVHRFVDGGGQELVLSGINLGRWGRDLSPTQSFLDLVVAILHQTALPRLRLSSIEPMDWTPDLLAIFREHATGPHPRLAPHAHLPLQSGSDTILRKMHRRYRPWHYAERTSAIRAALPDAAIGADIMVGFPGESDQLFQESYDFIAAQPFTYLHLFPFSPRPGTPGWELYRESPIPFEAVAERMAALRTLIEQKNLEFRSKFIGRQLSTVTLVTAQEVSERRSTNGITGNFVPVEIGAKIGPNRMILVEIIGLTAQGLCGTCPA